MGEGDDDVDDVEPRGQRLIDPATEVLGIADLREADLEVFRLTRRPGRGGIGIRDLGVGAEARAVGHGYAGPAEGTLEGALEIAVAREAQPPAHGVAQTHTLDGRNVVARRLATHAG